MAKGFCDQYDCGVRLQPDDLELGTCIVCRTLKAEKERSRLVKNKNRKKKDPSTENTKRTSPQGFFHIRGDENEEIKNLIKPDFKKHHTGF